MAGIAWADLTVADASTVRAFYEAVVGWVATPVGMDGYDDWAMGPPGAAPVAGVCHARGANAGLPPVWLMYVPVPDLDVALAACVALGGAVLEGPRSLGAYGRFAAIRDPAGASLALIEPPTSTS